MLFTMYFLQSGMFLKLFPTVVARITVTLRRFCNFSKKYTFCKLVKVTLRCYTRSSQCYGACVGVIPAKSRKKSESGIRRARKCCQDYVWQETVTVHYCSAGSSIFAVPWHTVCHLMWSESSTRSNLFWISLPNIIHCLRRRLISSEFALLPCSPHNGQNLKKGGDFA